MVFLYPLSIQSILALFYQRKRGIVGGSKLPPYCLGFEFMVRCMFLTYLVLHKAVAIGQSQSSQPTTNYLKLGIDLSSWPPKTKNA